MDLTIITITILICTTVLVSIHLITKRGITFRKHSTHEDITKPLTKEQLKDLGYDDDPNQKLKQTFDETIKGMQEMFNAFTDDEESPKKNKDQIKEI